MRTLPTAIQNAIAGQEIWPVRLISIQIGDTTYYISDHYRSLLFSGQTYLPNGNLLNIDNIFDATRANDDSITIALSGIDTVFRGDVIAADAVGGDVTIYRGLISPTSGVLLANPTLVYEGFIYSVQLSEDYPTEFSGDVQTTTSFTATVDVRATTFRLGETPGRQTNPASTQEVDPTDMSFEFVAGLNGRNLRFGGDD